MQYFLVNLSTIYIRSSGYNARSTINWNVYSLSPCADVSWPEFPVCPPDEDDDDDDAEDRLANLAKCDLDGADSISLADRAIFLPAFDTASPDADTSYNSN